MKAITFMGTVAINYNTNNYFKVTLDTYTAHKKLRIFDFGAKFLGYIIISRKCWIVS